MAMTYQRDLGCSMVRGCVVVGVEVEGEWSRAKNLPWVCQGR